MASTQPSHKDIDVEAGPAVTDQVTDPKPDNQELVLVPNEKSGVIESVKTTDETEKSNMLVTGSGVNLEDTQKVSKVHVEENLLDTKA